MLLTVKRHIGYLSNNTKLYGRLSSRELLQMLGTIYGIPEQTVEERIRQISEVLSMDAFLPGSALKKHPAGCPSSSAPSIPPACLR